MAYWKRLFATFIINGILGIAIIGYARLRRPFCRRSDRPGYHRPYQASDGDFISKGVDGK
jgi:hypothetical protein